MCNFLSGVTLATGDVSIGELVDSHEAIIEQAGWQNADKRTDGRMGLCRWEYTPTDGDWTKPLSEWVFRIDEYAIPEWWTPEHEATAISRAQAVLLRMLVLGGTHTVKTGRVFASGSATVRAYGSATVRAYDSATVEAYGSATVNTVYGEPKVAVADSAIELDRRGDIVIVRGNCKLAKAQGDA